MMASVLHWLEINYIELLAVLSGICYVVLAIRITVWLWLFGIISSTLYVWVFYQAGLYAYAALYVYYVAIGFYGWYQWQPDRAHRDSKAYSDGIGKAPAKVIKICIIITAALPVLLFFILKNFVSVGVALSDAVLTSGGMVATWMLARKFIEQWLFWIVINTLSMVVMLYKGLYLSAFLFLVYLMMAVKGYVTWRKALHLQTAK
jgi:nicotinamide mononucleotide transporter